MKIKTQYWKYIPVALIILGIMICAGALTARRLITQAEKAYIAALQEKNNLLQAEIIKRKELQNIFLKLDLKALLDKAIYQEAILLLASGRLGARGGFFVKSPPSTPQKTFVDPTSWGKTKPAFYTHSALSVPSVAKEK